MQSIVSQHTKLMRLLRMRRRSPGTYQWKGVVERRRDKGSLGLTTQSMRLCCVIQHSLSYPLCQHLRRGTLGRSQLPQLAQHHPIHPCNKETSQMANTSRGKDGRFTPQQMPIQSPRNVKGMPVRMQKPPDLRDLERRIANLEKRSK